MTPWRPGIVNVAVPLVPLADPVQPTLVYVPGTYPDPVAVIDPTSDWTFTPRTAAAPPPPSRLRVGLDSYPSPGVSNVKDASLPLCSSMVKVNVAANVGACPTGVIFKVGKFLYPKPWVNNVSESNPYPNITVPAAPEPVVSPVPGVNERVGADV